MIQHYLGSVYRWTCDMCGYHRVNTGIETTSLIQARHICEVDMDGFPVEHGKSLIIQSWEKLDRLIDTIKNPDRPEHEREFAKAQALGVAQVMVIFTRPHFNSERDISIEALARWTARQEGEERVTLGTSVARAAADLGVSLGTKAGSPASSARSAAPTSRPAPSRQFAPDEVTAIKNAHSMGFGNSDIAKMFKCTEANISAVLAS